MIVNHCTVEGGIVRGDFCEISRPPNDRRGMGNIQFHVLWAYRSHRKRLWGRGWLDGLRRAYRSPLSNVLNSGQHTAPQKHAELRGRAALILELLEQCVAGYRHFIPSTALHGAFRARSMIFESVQPGLPSFCRHSKNVRVAMKFSEA